MALLGTKDIFNLLKDDITSLEIRENSQKDNCLIRDKTSGHRFTSFVLDENSKTRILADVTFHRSSVTGKYLPRLTFKKTYLNNAVQETTEKKPVNISFKDSAQALVFWKLIGFLSSFIEVVDTGEFSKSYQLVPKDAYFVEFKTKSEKEKVEELKELILNNNIKENDIKSIVFENRKKTLRTFLFLIKNKEIKEEKAIEYYREKYKLPAGDETIWHHFLKNNDWILGLNVDIKFIQDFYDEQKVGSENSKGSGSPKSDLLGISHYTTLIELKHAATEIFKKVKSKSRANTWDFSSDFIEGISQCLGQKFALDKTYTSKEFVNDANERLDKNKTKTIDPKTVFIIGNRRQEFPHDNNNDNHIKSETFELFRRNNRNIDIVTYDELFERAYHIIFSERVKDNWFDDIDFDIQT